MRDAWLDLFHGSACVGCARPGRVLCPDCFLALPVRGRSVRPTPCPVGLASCVAAGEYIGLLRDLVLIHKERCAFPLARPLGLLLARASHPILDPSVETVLVPVPSRGVVVRRRGHDPMLRICRHAARRLRSEGRRVRVVRLLEQRTGVADQAGLDSVRRAINLYASMRVRAAARRRLARSRAAVSVVVCDDVLTTGATAREAQRALEDSGIGVRAVVTVAATRKQVPPG